MQFISFNSFDEFIDVIETRFAIANVEIDDEFRTHLLNVNETNSNACKSIEFIVFHEFIETNLRQCVARQYARELMKNHENEFANIFVFANERTFHSFAIVEIDDEERIREFARIYVNNNASIRVES
jgi:hypothetical protein